MLALQQRFNLGAMRKGKRKEEKEVGHALMPQLEKYKLVQRRRVRAATDWSAGCQDGLVKICARI